MSGSYVITEFRESELPTGVAARLRHHLLDPDGALHECLTERPRRDVGIASRLRNVEGFIPSQQTVGRRRIVVVALGSPPMMRLARRLGRDGWDVHLDVCDSLILQARERLRSKSIKLFAVAVWALALSFTVPNIPFIYITKSDRDADRLINRGRTVSVVPMRISERWRDLPRPQGPPRRLVLAGDMQSFHNQRGLAYLLDAARRAPNSLPIELYGPKPPSQELPSNVRFMGWAEDPTDTLAGDTAVYISNVGGSGAPNKLFEAVAARRHVIVHESMVSMLNDPSAHCSTFSTVGELAEILNSIGSRDENAF